MRDVRVPVRTEAVPVGIDRGKVAEKPRSLFFVALLCMVFKVTRDLFNETASQRLQRHGRRLGKHARGLL